MKKPKIKTVTLRQVEDALKANKSACKTSQVHHDIVNRINLYIDDDKRPLYVYCHTTGKKCGMTAIAYFQKKLAQYGNDIVKLMTEYRGRARGGMVVDGMPVKGKKSTDYKRAASRNPWVAAGSWTVKSDKKGEPLVTRDEFLLRDGGKVVREFDVATGEFKYIKGNAKMLVA